VASFVFVVSFDPSTRGPPLAHRLFKDLPLIFPPVGLGSFLDRFCFRFRFHWFSLRTFPFSPSLAVLEATPFFYPFFSRRFAEMSY